MDKKLDTLANHLNDISVTFQIGVLLENVAKVLKDWHDGESISNTKLDDSMEDLNISFGIYLKTFVKKDLELTK